jgi:hypothetical protein
VIGVGHKIVIFSIFLGSTNMVDMAREVRLNEAKIVKSEVL